MPPEVLNKTAWNLDPLLFGGSMGHNSTLVDTRRRSPVFWPDPNPLLSCPLQTAIRRPMHAVWMHTGVRIFVHDTGYIFYHRFISLIVIRRAKSVSFSSAAWRVTTFILRRINYLSESLLYLESGLWTRPCVKYIDISRLVRGPLVIGDRRTQPSTAWTFSISWIVFAVIALGVGTSWQGNP